MKKNKLLTSVIALGTAAALTLGGTFAWQSINQTVLNEASDVINPGGRLHDDFDGTDKNVYVENFTDPEKGGEDIFARVRLEEFFEIVLNAGTSGEKTVSMLGTKTQRTDDDGQPVMTESGTPVYDYVYDIFTDYQSGYSTDAGIVDDTAWWTWSTGGDTVFMPTFNKNKDSLKADINGEYKFNTGVITGKDIEGGQYTTMVTYEEDATKTANAIYDIDYNKIDEIAQEDLAAMIDSGTVPEAYQNNVKLLEETHTAKATPAASLMSMADWLEAVDENGYVEGYDTCWVYDTNGWVYWSAPIKAGEATGLLLDGIELNQVMDDTWYYAINVVAQFVTADDVGKENGTGFYDTMNGYAPSENAEKLLETIGVDMGGEGDIDDDDEPEDPAEEATISLALYDADGTEVTGSTLKANSTYDITATLNAQSGDFTIYDSRNHMSTDQKVSLEFSVPTVEAYDNGDGTYNTITEMGALRTGSNDTFNYEEVETDVYKNLTLHFTANDVKVYEDETKDGEPVETYSSLSASWNYYPEGGEVYQWNGGQDVKYVRPNTDNTVDTWSVVDGNGQPISAEGLTYELSGNSDENTTLTYQGGKIVLTIGDNETASTLYMTAKNDNGKANREIFVKYRGTLLVGETVLDVDSYNESVASILSSPDATKSYTLTYKDFWGNEVSGATFYIAHRGLIDYGTSILGNMLVLGTNEHGLLGIAVCGGMSDYPNEEIVYYFTPAVEQPEAATITIKINGEESHIYNNGDEVSDFALSVGDTMEISCSDSRFDHWEFTKSGLDAPDNGNTITFNEVYPCTFVINALDKDGLWLCTIWLNIIEG